MIADTDAEAERFLIQRLSRAEPWRKAQMVLELTRTVRSLAAAGVRHRYPTASEREVRLRVAALCMDRETMIRAFGWDPEVEGY